MSENTENQASESESTQGEQAANEAPVQDGGSQEQIDWKAEAEKYKKLTKDWEKKAKGEAGSLTQENEELRAKLEGREKEYQAEQERREIESAALQKANERILQAEIRAAAAGKLNDASDALRYLDLSSFEVGEDGAVDTQAVSAAIDDLTQSKPYLAAQGGKRFQGSADGGARESSGPAQLSRSDLSGMSTDQINSARAEGRLNDLLGLK
ncbi:hypothetical protein [Nesterenkonia haasae]|uniref:hypothetical protein n=1 Tax=Nesterenkonia haasae TaxID=2587813 RepID=UPI0013912B44|nr:hypothetical protein [Nesterenkonia haasae]NDK31187.1 hypothetical protein [Nesterenkonia haasae]